MRILQLCHKMPYPPKDGGAIATLNLTESLAAQGAEMAILAMTTEKYNFNVENLPEYYKRMAQWKTVDVKAGFRYSLAILSIFKNKSYNIERYIHKSFEEELIKTLETFKPDWVQLEGLYATPYIRTIRKNSNAKISFRAHNIEFRIWQGLANKVTAPLKRIYLQLLAYQLREYEIDQLNKPDCIVSISPVDAELFKTLGCKVPIEVCPASVSSTLINKPFYLNNKYTSIFFIGSLDSMPNIEGLYWFLHNVWPLIHKKHPGLKFYVAGRNMPYNLLNENHPNVVFMGEIDDAYKFMESNSIMVVPLRSGSGVRVKILEGMAIGKTIISTTIGAQGIHCRNEKEILIANNPEAFLKYITKCLEDRDFYTNIGINAKEFIAMHYESSEVAKQLLDFYKSFGS